jgi:hypothetical protein
MEVILSGVGAGPQSRGAGAIGPNGLTDIVSTAGQFYAPGDTSILAGGLLIGGGTPTSLTALTTQVVSATLVNGGSGGTPGSALVNTTTGTGGPAQLAVTISGTGNQTITAEDGGGGLGYIPGDILTVAGGTGTAGTILVNAVGVGAAGWMLSNSGTLGTPGTYTGNVFILSLPFAPGVVLPCYFEGTIGAGGDLTSINVFHSGSFAVIPAGTVFDLGGGSTGLTGAQVTITQWTIVPSVPPYGGSSIMTAGDYTVPPPNPASVTGGSGTGAAFTLTYSSGSGSIVSIDGINLFGTFTVNPTVLSDEPVVDASSSSITGAAVNLVMGVNTSAITVVGEYAVPPISPISEASSSAAGVGATYNLQYFGNLTAGSLVYLENPETGLVTSFTSDPSNHTTATFDYPMGANPFIEAVAGTIVASGSNSASYSNVAMPLVSSTDVGSPGLFTGQLSVDMISSSLDPAQGGADVTVLEVQILLSDDSTAADAALASILAYYGL